MTSENQATSAQHQISDLIHPNSVIQGQREGIASLFSPSSDDETSAYALHGFVATVEGQLSVIRGDKLLVLDDGNTYWWLVKRVNTSESGYVPAENIETPFERLARFNKIRNTEIAPISISEAMVPGRSTHKRVSIATKISIQYMVIDTDNTTHITETFEESQNNTQESSPRISDHVSSMDLTRHFIQHHTPKYRILRVFAGNLSGHALFKSVVVQEGTTGTHLLRLALERFRLLPAPSSWVEYYLTIQQGDGEERRVLSYDKPYTMAIPSVRFSLSKRIKCMHDHEIRIKIAYYTPCTKWYDRHTKADRIEKVVAVPAAATITELTTLALQKFHLRHGVPYTCSTGTEKYGMTVLLQGKERILKGRFRVMELLNEPGLEGNEDQVLFVLRKMQARIATERTLLSIRYNDENDDNDDDDANDDSTTASCRPKRPFLEFLNAPTQRPMYIRVKRDKLISFLCIKPTDTILSIKQQLIPLMAKTKPADDLRLYISTGSSTGRLLEDHQTAKSAGLENDELVYLVYFDHTSGKWEDIYVAEYESLDDDMDDTMDLAEEASKRKEKGKGRA